MTPQHAKHNEPQHLGRHAAVSESAHAGCHVAPDDSSHEGCSASSGGASRKDHHAMSERTDHAVYGTAAKRSRGQTHPPRRERAVRDRRIVALVAVLAAVLVAVVVVAALALSGSRDQSTVSSTVDSSEATLAVADRVLDESAVEAAPDESLSSEDLIASINALTDVDIAAYPIIASALDAYTAQGYVASFLLCDLDTGNIVGYNLDRTYFCASAIKAPFVAYVLGDLVEADPAGATLEDVLIESESIGGTGEMDTDGVYEYALSDVIEQTIVNSDNTGYRMLWRAYGGTGFDAWAERSGVAAATIAGAEYPSLSVRDFAKLWVGIESYIRGGSDQALWLEDLLLSTQRSSLRTVAGSDATVLSKPGFETNRWYSDATFDYGALHDAGIVSDDQGRWIVVVMSNADYDTDYQPEFETLIDGLIAALLESRIDVALSWDADDSVEGSDGASGEDAASAQESESVVERDPVDRIDPS